MNRSFLYRLYQYSRPGFFVLLIFIAAYIVTWSKKMDMMLFPYNAMFAFDRPVDSTVTAYIVKVNGQPVRITQFPYWKKDFLETSLKVYAHYIQSGEQLYIDQYLQQKFGHGQAGEWLRQQLTPRPSSVSGWLVWYADFAGIHVRPGSRITLQAVYMQRKEAGFALVDSIPIHSIMVP